MQNTLQTQAASAASTLALLQTLYPGAVLLDTNQVAAAVGLSAKAIQKPAKQVSDSVNQAW
ncbi:hypothetical protein MASR1M60_18050 [Rhodocyclaceae bacterium]